MARLRSTTPGSAAHSPASGAVVSSKDARPPLCWWLLKNGAMSRVGSGWRWSRTSNRPRWSISSRTMSRGVRRSQPLKSDLRKGAPSVVPLADRAIGNLQQWLIGTYHGVSKAQLQVYLDEFVFRHNRRKTPAAAFQTLLGLGTGRKSTEYEQIRGARDLNHNRLGVAEATR